MTRVYISVEPMDLDDLLAQTGWARSASEGYVEDGHGNEALVVELDDGHLQLEASDGNDLSELLERVPFHLEDD